jgi:hypothetical protein
MPSSLCSATPAHRADGYAARQGRTCARTARHRRPRAPPRSRPALRRRRRRAGGRARAPGQRRVAAPHPGLRPGRRTAAAMRRASAQGPTQVCCDCCSRPATATAAGCLSVPGTRRAAARRRPRPPGRRSGGSGHLKCPSSHCARTLGGARRAAARRRRWPPGQAALLLRHEGTVTHGIQL